MLWSFRLLEVERFENDVDDVDDAVHYDDYEGHDEFDVDDYYLVNFVN